MMQIQKLQFKLSNFYYRISNAFKIGFWVLKNPQTIKHSNLKMLSDLYVLIMNVATEHTHYMANIGTIHPDGEKTEIVSLWAGAGIGADPTKRIAELLKENAILKAELSRKLIDNN